MGSQVSVRSFLPSRSHLHVKARKRAEMQPIIPGPRIGNHAVKQLLLPITVRVVANHHLFDHCPTLSLNASIASSS